VCIGVVANVSITVSLKSLRSLHSFAILGSILSIGGSRIGIIVPAFLSFSSED